MSVFHDDNHEHVQSFDEVVFIWQPWGFATRGYNLFKISAYTRIALNTSFQNHPPNTNINLVPTDSMMEWFHLLNRLEQLHHIDWRPLNQLVSIHY
jgi:hypothetical protein